MKPSHIDIVGRSKFKFSDEILPGLGLDRFTPIIDKIGSTSNIILNQRVHDVSDIVDLINYLVKRGIPRTDIRIRYPQERGSDALQRALSHGLIESGLDFGSDVAERDEGLTRYFITTTSYKAVESHKRHIVVGPKGSGKSAILKELSKRELNTLVITPEHYATDILETIKKVASVSEVAAYTTTWKYTLLVEIFRKLIQRQVGDNRGLAEIRKYLVSRGHLNGDLSLFERFMGYLKRITQLKGKVSPAEGQVYADTAEELNKLFKMDELLQLLPALERVLRKSSFTVYLDELDQSWNNTDTANGFLTALLIAAIQLRGISENLHVVVFLRSEIFDMLKPHLAQLDKLRSDIEALHWSKKELTNLVVSRAVDSLKITADFEAADAIKYLFPGTFEDTSISSFEYLLSRTSMRPREVIQFCNLALRIAQDDGLSTISVDSIQRAEEQFSSWKLEHIVSENMFIYPGLDNLLEQLRGHLRLLDKTSLHGLLADLILNALDASPQPAWLKPNLGVESLLKLLYELEVIGIERPEARTSHSDLLWEQYDYVFARPKARPEESGTFLFHPGLWKSLDLR